MFCKGEELWRKVKKKYGLTFVRGMIRFKNRVAFFGERIGGDEKKEKHVHW